MVRPRAKIHKKLYRNFRYVVFGLTASSTALAGLALALQQYRGAINVAIVFTTASIGVVTSIEGLRKAGELWIHERTVYYSLRDLERDLGYRSAEEADPFVVDDIYQRMQEVLGSARDRWSRNAAGRSSSDTNAAHSQ
jgi:hypothetical protein